MAYFPDNSPHQVLLVEAKTVQEDYSLTTKGLAIVILSVLAAVTDPYDTEGEQIKRKHRV